MKEIKLFCLMSVLCFSAMDATSAWSYPMGGGGTAVREGRSTHNTSKTECMSCSGQADHKLGVCYRQYPGKAAGCERAKNTWLAKCIRTCTNNR